MQLSTTCLLMLFILACGDSTALPDAAVPPDAAAADGGARDGAREEDGGLVDMNTRDDAPADDGGVDLGSYDGGPITETTPYEDLFAHRSGFAASVVGGAGGRLIVLNTLDFEPFREAVEGDGARWIRFAPGLTGAIQLDSSIEISAHTTIDGRGADITLTAPDDCTEITFWRPERTHLIIHNITFFAVGAGNNCGQAFGMAFGSNHVWLDHVTFRENGDESVSTGFGATDLTVSYSLFENTVKGMLFGWGDDDPDRTDENTRVTVHHSAYLPGETRVSRLPFARMGRFHLYNNVIVGWGWQASHAVDGAQMRVEYSHYDGQSASEAALASSGGGRVCDVNNTFVDCVQHDDGSGFDCDGVFAPSDSYAYAPEENIAAMREHVLANAGRHDTPMW